MYIVLSQGRVVYYVFAANAVTLMSKLPLLVAERTRHVNLVHTEHP